MNQPVVSQLQMAINLADEGIPIAAIARATGVPSDQIREHLRAAVEEGRIVELPKNDWPPGSPRSTRVPELAAVSDDHLLIDIKRAFKMTKLQANGLLVLIKHSEVSKQRMHTALQNPENRDGDTNVKIVDVVICHLRKKLTPLNIEIETIWSFGYCLTPENRQKILDHVAQFRATLALPVALGAPLLPAARNAFDEDVSASEAA
jgi:hypothetical protein